MNDPIVVSVVYDTNNEFALERGADGILRLASAVERLQTTASGSRAALRAVENDIRRFSTYARSAATNGINTLTGSVNLLYGGLARLSRFSFYALTAGVASSVYTLKNLGREFLSVNEQFQGLEITLRSAFSSTRIAKGLRDELVRITASSPLPFKDLADITRAAATIPQLSTQIGKQYSNNSLSDPKGFLRGHVTLVEQLVAFRPDKNAEDATFSIREAVSGELRSLIRRFDIPPALLVAASGRSISDLKTDPLGMLDAIKKAMNRIISPEAINEFKRTPSRLMEGLREQLLTIPLLKTGEGGIYRQLNNVIGDVFDLATKFVTERGDVFGKRFSDALSGIFEPLVDGLDRALDSVLSLFGLSNRDNPGLGRMERIARLIEATLKKSADLLPGLVDWAERLFKTAVPAFLKLSELGGDIVASVSKALPGFIRLIELFANFLSGLSKLVSDNPTIAALELIFLVKLPDIMRLAGQLAITAFTRGMQSGRVALLNGLLPSQKSTGTLASTVGAGNIRPVSATAATRSVANSSQGSALLATFNPSAKMAAANAAAYKTNQQLLTTLGYAPQTPGSHIYQRSVGGIYSQTQNAMGGAFTHFGTTQKLKPVTGPAFTNLRQSQGAYAQQLAAAGMRLNSAGQVIWGSAASMAAAGYAPGTFKSGQLVPNAFIPASKSSPAAVGAQGLPQGFISKQNFGQSRQAISQQLMNAQGAGKYSAALGGLAGAAALRVGASAATAGGIAGTAASVAGGLASMLGPILLVTGALTALSAGITWVSDEIARNRKAQGERLASGITQFSDRQRQNTFSFLESQGDFLSQIEAFDLAFKGANLEKITTRGISGIDFTEQGSKIIELQTAQKFTQEEYVKYVNGLLKDEERLSEILVSGEKVPKGLKITGSDFEISGLDNVSKALDAVRKYLLEDAPKVFGDLNSVIEKASADQVAKGTPSDATEEIRNKLAERSVKVKKFLDESLLLDLAAFERDIETLESPASFIEGSKAASMLKDRLTGVRAEASKNAITVTGEFFKELDMSQNPLRDVLPNLASELDRQRQINEVVAEIQKMMTAGNLGSPDIDVERVKTMASRIAKGDFGTEAKSLLPRLDAALLARESGVTQLSGLQGLISMFEQERFATSEALWKSALMSLTEGAETLLNPDTGPEAKQTSQRLSGLFKAVDDMNRVMGTDFLSRMDKFIEQLASDSSMLAELPGAFDFSGQSSSLRQRLTDRLSDELEKFRNSPLYQNEEGVRSTAEGLENILKTIQQQGGIGNAADRIAVLNMELDRGMQALNYFGNGGFLEDLGSNVKTQIDALNKASELIKRQTGLTLSDNTKTFIANLENTGHDEFAGIAALSSIVKDIEAAIEVTRNQINTAKLGNLDSSNAVKNLNGLIDLLGGINRYLIDLGDAARNRYAADFDELVSVQDGIRSVGGERNAEFRERNYRRFAEANNVPANETLIGLSRMPFSGQGSAGVRPAYLKQVESELIRLGDARAQQAKDSPLLAERYEKEARALYMQADAAREAREAITGRGGAVNSFIEGFGGEFSRWSDELTNFTSVGSELAQSFANNLGSATSDILLNVESLGDAAEQFGKTMLRTAVQLFSNKLVMMIFGGAWGTLFGTASNGAIGSGLTGGGGGIDINAPITSGMEFEKGGRIPGAPSFKDNLLIQAASGEYVIPTKTVNKFGAAHFDYYKRGELPPGIPAYAEGGLVGTSVQHRSRSLASPARSVYSGPVSTGPISVNVKIDGQNNVSTGVQTEKGAENFGRAIKGMIDAGIAEALRQGGPLKKR